MKTNCPAVCIEQFDTLDIYIYIYHEFTSRSLHVIIFFYIDKYKISQNTIRSNEKKITKKFPKEKSSCSVVVQLNYRPKVYYFERILFSL